MKYYVLKNNKKVIYGGLLAKTKAENGSDDYIHDIKIYFTKDANGEFVEYPNPDSHVEFVLTKEFSRGLVDEYPTLDAAKTAIAKK